MHASDTAGANRETYVGLPMADAVTHDFVRDFGNRWEAAWNSHDTDEVMALIHPDIRWNDTIFWPDVIRGQDAMRAYVDKIWAVMPDVHSICSSRRRARRQLRARIQMPPLMAATSSWGSATGCCPIIWRNMRLPT
jgi:hypothetical protein